MATGNTLKYALDTVVTSSGSIGIGTVSNEGRVRFVISEAGAGNLIRVRARITGQTTWIDLADLTGNVNQLVDVYTYDQIEVIVLVYQTSTNRVVIQASSFDGSSVSFSTPNGDLTDVSTVNFTSSDGSVEISADPLTGTLDLKAVGSGGSMVNSVNGMTGTVVLTPSDIDYTPTTPSDWSNLPANIQEALDELAAKQTVKYTTTFTNATWALDAEGYYIQIPFSTHQTENPLGEIYEIDAGVEYKVEANVEVDSSDNIRFTIQSNPDLRFSGKIVIL